METFRPWWYTSLQEMCDNIPNWYEYQLDYLYERYDDDWVVWFILKEAN